jgi:FkbM family methyltransferase
MVTIRVHGCRSGRRQLISGAARVKDFIQQCTKAVTSTVAPSWARWLLARAALAPPIWKTPLFERVCDSLVRNSLGATEDVVVTNFGLGVNLRCLIGLRKTAYAFGKIEHMLSERATFALVEELAADCKEFVDVGANEGAFTFLVHRNFPQMRLHWFEPDRQLARRLATNLAANNIIACGNEMAAAERKGTATFFKNLSDDSSGSLTSLFAQKHVTRTEIVETISLAEYFREREIADALVKVDVEGAGERVWDGAIEMSKAVRYLVMEMLSPEIKAALPGKIIRQTDLKAYYIRDFELVPSVDGAFEYVAPFWNWLFCRLCASELAERLSATRFRVRNGG